MKRSPCLGRPCAVSKCAAWLQTAMRILVTAAALAVVCVTVHPCAAREPIAELLTALQARGEWSVANQYLDHLSGLSELVTLSERNELGYHRGTLLLAQAELDPSSSRQAELAERAAQSLQDFLRSNPHHELSGATQVRLGDLSLWLAKQMVRESPHDPVKLEEANQRMQQAQNSFRDGHDLIKQQLSQLPSAIDPKLDPKNFRLRRQWQTEYLKALLSHAIAELDRSSLPSNAEQRDRLLEQALTQFQTIASKYRMRLEAAAARLYIAQCHLERHESAQALGYLTELLEARATHAGLFPLQTRALALAAPIWMSDPDSARPTLIRYGEAWLESAGKPIPTDPDALLIQLHLAQAYLAESQAVEGNESKRLRTQARQLAQRAAQVPGPHQTTARTLLSDLGLEPAAADVTLSEDPVWKEPVTAGDALQMARQWIAQHGELSIDSSANPSGQDVLSASEPGSDSVSIEKIRSRRTLLSALGRRALRTAMLLSTDPSFRKEARALQAYLELREGRHWEAAILGDYLLRAHPDSPAARDTGPITLSAWTQAYQEATESAKGVVEQRLLAAAELLGRHAAGKELADRSALVAAKLMAHQGRFEEASTWVLRIPAASPLHRSAQIFLAQSLLDHSQKASNDEQRESLRQRGLQVLQETWDGIRPLPASEETIRTALLIATAQRESDADSTESLLRDPVHGPLTLLEQRSPVLLQNPALLAATYQLALRESILRLQANGENAENVQRCVAILQDVLAMPATTPQETESRIALYATLANEAGSLLLKIGGTQRPVLARSLLEAMRGLVSEDRESQQLAWVSTALHQLAQGLQAPAAPPPHPATAAAEPAPIQPAAKELVTEILQLAISADTILMARFQPQGSTPDPDMHVPRMQAGQRLATALVELRKFEAAIRTFGELLNESPHYINLQVLAAHAYQSWGDAGAPQRYREAIEGGLPNAAGKPTLWGWGMIAATTARNNQHRAIMLDARIHLAECRLAWARHKSGDERLALLRSAKRDIRMTPLLVPAAAEEPWRSRYDQLLRRIQKELGEVAAGLPANTTTVGTSNGTR